ncbi:MAG: hypothetical protein M5T52_02645 [Ignavibacteriaceae bacterium]|nr:hypothetical protein [Ignavibacteriaceae bacterium]
MKCDVMLVNGRTKEGLQKLIDLMSSNLESNYQISNKITPYPNLKDNTQLLDSFNEIEKIIQQVYEPISSDLKIDLKSANKELKVLTDSNLSNNFPIDQATLKIDKILLHRFWGFVIFLIVMGITFTSIFWLAQPLMNFVDELFTNLNNLVVNNFDKGWFTYLVSDGIISGTGSVLVFVPQILILFLILGLLEDSGYLARGAMLIDKPLSKVGLNGRSFVPMLSGFACAIPAMIAARTIPNRKERLFTIFIIPLMSCSARLPVYALLIAYIIPQDKPWDRRIYSGWYLFIQYDYLIVSRVDNK